MLLLTEKIKKIMEKQKTAVEWLISKIGYSFLINNCILEKAVIQHAIEMEKNQIIEANETYSQNGNDYYSKKYGKQDANI